MADHRAHLALHQPQGHVQQILHVAVGDQQLEGVNQEGVLQPGAMHGEMRHPPHIDAPNYYAAHYPPPPPYPQVPQVPYMQMYQDERVAEPVPAQAHPFAQGVQHNHEGYGAHFPADDHPEAFPYVLPYPAPHPDLPPAANGLIDLVGRLLNNPGTLVNMLRIEPGPGGHLEVWIALELANIYIF